MKRVKGGGGLKDPRVMKHLAPSVYVGSYFLLWSARREVCLRDFLGESSFLPLVVVGEVEKWIENFFLDFPL